VLNAANIRMQKRHSLLLPRIEGYRQQQQKSKEVIEKRAL
jgi:hypothetical protein